MLGINMVVYLDESLDGWVAYGNGQKMTARELTIQPDSEGYLILYVDQDPAPNGERLYRVRQVRHLSIYQDEAGFRWAHRSVEFSLDWDVLVDDQRFKL